MPPNKMKEIEMQEGRPIQEILQELFDESASQSEVARKLGINGSTLAYWLLKLGLTPKTILVKRDVAHDN